MSAEADDFHAVQAGIRAMVSESGPFRSTSGTSSLDRLSSGYLRSRGYGHGWNEPCRNDDWNRAIPGSEDASLDCHEDG